MFATKLVKFETMYTTDTIFTNKIVSSTYLFQSFKYSVKVGTNIFSTSTVEIPANTGPVVNPWPHHQIEQSSYHQK